LDHGQSSWAPTLDELVSDLEGVLVARPIAVGCLHARAAVNDERERAPSEELLGERRPSKAEDERAERGHLHEQ
jgi:hypothetical protein